jgi:hypothetical protein
MTYCSIEQSDILKSHFSKVQYDYKKLIRCHSQFFFARSSRFVRVSKLIRCHSQFFFARSSRFVRVSKLIRCHSQFFLRGLVVLLEFRN